MTLAALLFINCEKDPDMGVMWKLQLPPQQSGNLAVRAALAQIYPRTGIETLVWASVSRVDQRDLTESTGSDEGSLVFGGCCAHTQGGTGAESTALEQSGFDGLRLTIAG